MTKTQKINGFIIEDDSTLTDDAIRRRTDIAKMHQLELSVNKEYVAFQERCKNICRIDSALESFDGFLSDFVTMLQNLPDMLQTMIPSMGPSEYKDVQQFLDSQIQRIGERRVYLAIDSTAEQMARATEIKNESIQKNAKIKGKK